MTPEQESEVMTFIEASNRTVRGMAEMLLLLEARCDALKDAVLMCGATPELLEKRFEHYSREQAKREANRLATSQQVRPKFDP